MLKNATFLQTIFKKWVERSYGMFLHKEFILGTYKLVEHSFVTKYSLAEKP